MTDASPYLNAVPISKEVRDYFVKIQKETIAAQKPWSNRKRQPKISRKTLP
jgi:hypothetical protein